MIVPTGLLAAEPSAVPFGWSKISCNQESNAGISKSIFFQAKQAAKFQTNSERGLAETLQETI